MSKRVLFFFVAILLLTTLPLFAASFLTPAQALEAVIDDKPWSVVTSDGKRAQLTLRKDGGGRFEGPITVSAAWEVKGEEICVRLSLAGTKCLRFSPAPGGYEAWQAGKLDLTLTR